MKKKRYSRIGHVLGGLVNPRLWFDWDRLRAFSLYLRTVFQRFFVPQPALPEETFENALKRLKISEAELTSKQRALYHLSWIMALLAAGILVYSIYHMFYGTFKAAIVSLMVFTIAAVMSFRYNFWYFQIKSRRLGCSVKEWYRQSLLGEKK